MTIAESNKIFKQAILITAFRDFDHLIDIINYFDEDFNIYIHIDNKNKPQKGIEDKIKYNNNIRLLSYRYKINWGGLNHLKSYIFLAEEALRNEENIYFHLITGQDYPAKPLHLFKKFIDESNNKDYLTFFEMPAECWDNGGMDRIIYYNFYDIFDSQNKGMKWIDKFLSIQKMLHIKRSISPNIPKLYGGSTYWTLTRPTLQYIVNYTDMNRHLINRMKHTFCAEEIYFQTIIMNSEYSNNVINDNLRYIDWDSNKGGSPAILEAHYIKVIESSNKLFARKFESPLSDSLKLMINELKYQKGDADKIA